MADINLQSIQFPGLDDTYVIPSIQAYLPTDSATGSIATFTDGAEDMPVEDLTINIDYSSDGYTGATVTRAGLNLLPPYEFTSVGDATISSSDGVYTIDGTVSSYSQKVASDTFSLPAGTYTLNSNQSSSTNYLTVQIRSTDGTTTYAVSSTSSSSFTLTETTEVKFRITSNATTYSSLVISPQLEYGSTATGFEAYTSTEYSVDWSSEAGTIYGGTLDLTTGVLTSTYDSDGTALDTSTTYSLDPIEVTTILGDNNIWADTGDTTVEYKADIQLYIDKVVNS